MKVSLKWLLMLTLLLGIRTLSGGENPLLSVGFDESLQPRPGGGELQSHSPELSFTAGRFGRALQVEPGRNFSLNYRLPRSVSPDSGWSLLCHLRAEELEKGREQILFRLQRSSSWQKGNIHALWTPWGNFHIEQLGDNGHKLTNIVNASALPMERWFHLAIVCRNGNTTLYIDGEPLKWIRQVRFEPIAQQELRVGEFGLPELNFHGAIDELQFYGYALDRNEVRAAMNRNPSVPKFPDPVLHLPLNGRVDPVFAPGIDATISAEGIVFKPAVKGRGSEFRRFGYDRASRMEFGNMEQILETQGAVSLYFIPASLPPEDRQLRGLVAATGKSNSWLLARQGEKLFFTLKSGNRELTLSAPVKWLAGKPYALCAMFNEREAALWLNGVRVAQETVPDHFSLTATTADVVVGDLPRPDMYRISQSEGIIDELRIFNRNLPEKVIRQLADTTAERAVNNHFDYWNIPPSAATGQERRLWALEDAEQRENECRKIITLNGLWRFRPFRNSPPDQNEWYYFPVPGRIDAYSWSDAFFYPRDRQLKQLRDGKLPDGTELRKIRESCWERELIVKPEWRNRKLNLFFDDFSAETGRIFLNGRFLAEVCGRHSHRVELPQEMIHEGSNFLQVILSDSHTAGWSGHWRGFRGNLFLEILPEVQLGRTRISTSVSRRILTVRQQVCNRSPKARNLSVRLTVSGERAPRESDTLIHSLNLQSGEEREITFQIPWRDARLWSPDDPYLYSLETVLEEGDILMDRLFPQRFGFREFTVSGRNYLLNGRRIHLYNNEEWRARTFDREDSRQFLRKLKSMNYNSIRLPFSVMDDQLSTMLEIADEEGVLLFANVYGVNGAEFADWDNPETRQRLYREMSGVVQDLANHPSLVMWYLSVNFISNNYHPLCMNEPVWTPEKRAQFQVMEQGAAILRKLDPDRPWFYQSGGAFSPIINSNTYFCWWPQAERRAWAQEWSRIGSKPLHVIETAFPYIRSFEGMSPGLFDVDKIRFYFEDCARYFGNAAYDSSEQDLLHAAQISRYGQEVGHFDERARRSRLLMKLKAYLISDTIPAWRISGVSGICPFAEYEFSFDRRVVKEPLKERQVTDHRRIGWQPDRVSNVDAGCRNAPLPPFFALQYSFAPRAAYLIGEPDYPFSQAGNYWSGDRLRRQLAVCSNLPYSLPWRARITLREAEGENEIGRCELSGTLEPGGETCVPFEMTLPRVSSRHTLLLRAECDLGGETKTVEATLSVFPEPDSLKTEAIVVFDPAGLSQSELRRSGVSITPCREHLPENTRLLVVGKGALDQQEFFRFSRKNKLSTRVRNGLSILFLEQTASGLAKLKLQTGDVDLRSLFKISEKAFPTGLNERELAAWHGVSPQVPGRVLPPPETLLRLSRLWRWNTYDMTCSTPIRRPSGFRAISWLSGGLDLAWSALLELPEGDGRLIFCQAELSGRGKQEPAAVWLLREMLIQFSKRTETTAEKPLRGDDLKTPEQIESFLQEVASGRRAIVTRVSPQLLTRLGLQCREEQTILLKLGVAAGVESTRFSRRDLFFTVPISYLRVSGPGVEPLSEPAMISRLKNGRGEICFFTPDLQEVTGYLERLRRRSLRSADYWGWHVIYERLRQLEFAFGGSPESCSPYLEKPLPIGQFSLDGVWEARRDARGNDSVKNLAGASPEEFKERLTVPGFWEKQAAEFAGYDGVVWYRRHVTLPQDFRGRKLRLMIERVDDLDTVWINGVQIGSTTRETPGYWEEKRSYSIPAELTSAAELELLIRVEDLRGNGGICGHAKLQIADGVGPETDMPGYDTESMTIW